MILVTKPKETKLEGGEQLEGLNQPSAKAACQERGARLVEVTFLAALAALYLTLVSESLTHCHFRISIQRVTFET